MSTNSDHLQDLQYEMTLSYSVTRALIRCLNAKEILEVFDFTFQQSFEVRISLVRRLVYLCEQSKRSRLYAKKLISRLLATETSIPSSRKAAFDGTLLKLMPFIGEEEQLKLYPAFIMERRRTKRKLGYDIVTRLNPEDCRVLLLNCFEKYNDEDALVALARSQNDIFDIAEYLLSNISTHSTQARVFENLLEHYFDRAVNLAAQYPTAFAWAVGRTRKTEAVATVVQIYKKNIPSLNLKDIDIGLIVWALGRTEAKQELLEIAIENGITLL